MPRIEYPAGSGGGGGGGAPANATYLTLSVDGTLTDERVFTPAARLSATDGGAGGLYTLDLSAVAGVAGSYTYASLTVDGYGRVTAVGSGVAPVTAVNVDAGELTTTGGTTPSLGLANAGTAGTYAYPSSMTTDAFGRVTAVTAGVAPAASGWTDGGTVVYLTTLTDQVAIGSTVAAPQRSLTVQNTSASTLFGMRVVTDAASTETILDTLSLNGAGPDDTVPRFAVTGNGDLAWSSGSAAIDLRMRRSGVNTLTLDNGVNNGATIVPATDAQGVLGTNNLRWSDFIANTHRVFPSAGAVNASSSLASGALKLGVGGATALDTQISRTGTKTLTVDDNAAGSAVLIVKGQTTTQTRALEVSTIKTTAYVVAATDDVVLADPTAASFDVTLPNANVVKGRRVQVKRTTTSANTVTVKSGGGTIDNVAAATGIVLAGGALGSITVVSDGTNWWIL